MSKDRSDERTEARMTLGEHLEELRRRIIYALIGLVLAMAGSLYFASDIIAMLKGPYVRVMEKLELEPILIVLDVTSGLTNYLKVSLYAGVVFASPWIFYHLWMFIAAGLYKRERRYVTTAVPFSAVLFVAGAMFFLFVVSERVMYFLLWLSKQIGTVPRITFENHISFMATMMVLFGVAFQTPLAILFLGYAGLVTPRTLNKYRRHMIVLLLVLAAMFTPPDPFSQIALAIPMWVLYELGVLLVYVLVTRKRRARRERQG